MDSSNINLSWDDLIVNHLTAEEIKAWLGDWEWFGMGQIAPVFLSRFGNWFFRCPDGSVHMLDVCSAEIGFIAPDFEHFQRLVNTQDWQEKFLYSALLLKYRRQGLVARGRDAIGFTPPPVFVKSLDDCKPMVLDMHVWQSICGQTMQQVTARRRHLER
jgi:hypothetical protein